MELRWTGLFEMLVPSIRLDRQFIVVAIEPFEFSLTDPECVKFPLQGVVGVMISEGRIFVDVDPVKWSG